MFHACWLAAAFVGVLVGLWPSLPSPWRYILLGLLIYSGIVTPVTLAQTLRGLWNAPRAAELNRELSTPTRR